MKLVVITGCLGLIGSYVTARCLAKGWKVYGIDNCTYAANVNFLEVFHENPNFTFVKEDIAQLTYLPDCDYVINVAAESHVGNSIVDSADFIQTNVVGVKNLLDLIRRKQNNVSDRPIFFHFSTDEVYGDIKLGKSSNETSAYNPSSPYSATKASADMLIKSFIRTYKLPVIISNCCNNYGPNQFPEKLIPKLIYNIITNKPLPIYGKGKNLREWMYVIDHCEALLKIYFKGKIGESYNVGSNQSINNVNLTKKLLKVVNNKSFMINKKVKIIFVKDRPGHDFRYALNSNKILKKLRWKAKISLQEGLSQTLDWYINNKSFFNSVSKKLHINRLGLKT